ncbi:MAG: glutamate 5-kinase [Chloroflexota bacterium]|nr:glutamate 5-kinase [Chloroflexota bacterium]MDE2899330.1 glutamate 5-kinase [Chloroflexota bacterium]
MTLHASRRIVVKCGTRLLAGESGVNQAFVANMARQIARIRLQGTQVALVTSGAVAVGRSIVALPGDALVTRQVLAAIGQAPLMAQYSACFAGQGMTVAQTLLSRADLHNRTGYLNARNALTGLFDAGVVPIANENDVVATEELRFGDNDRLSVLIAKLIGADRLYILSRTAGLYTADPECESTAELIPDASALPRAELERIAGGASQGGLGGMRSKLQAALEASADGVDVVIAGGDEADVIVRLEAGERLGTRFPSQGPRRSSRARWLSSSVAQRGSIVVDDGARRALVSNGSSLLPAGITRVEGAFERGDLVSLMDARGNVFARGLVNYPSGDLARIRGQPSTAIGAILGASSGDEAVHRNNLVLIDRDAE